MKKIKSRQQMGYEYRQKMKSRQQMGYEYRQKMKRRVQPVLPVMTQANILTEIRNDPSQVAHIKALLAQPNPTAAILKDQEKTALEIVKPGMYPGQRNKWPVFQKHFKKGYGIAVRRAARARLQGIAGGIDWGKYAASAGGGAAVATAGKAATSTGSDASTGSDWAGVLGSVMGVALQYGVPAIQKAAAKKAEKTKDRREKRLLEQAAKAEIVAAKEEQTKAADQVMEVAPPTPPSAKKLSTGVKIGIGVGAAAVGGVLILALTKKR